MRNIPSKKTLMAQIRDSEKTGQKTNDIVNSTRISKE